MSDAHPPGAADRLVGVPPERVRAARGIPEFLGEYGSIASRTVDRPVWWRDSRGKRASALGVLTPRSVSD